MRATIGKREYKLQHLKLNTMEKVFKGMVQHKHKKKKEHNNIHLKHKEKKGQKTKEERPSSSMRGSVELPQ